jgi:hypothetical protein
MKIQARLVVIPAALTLCGITLGNAQDAPGVPAPPQPAAPAALSLPASTGAEPGIAPAKAPLPPVDPMRRASQLYSDRLQRIVGTAYPGSANAQTLVVAPSGIESEDLSNLQEDMSVMAHILEKAVDEKRRAPGYTALGIDVFFAPGTGPHRNLFLEGYGALFTLNVGFPLLPPATKAEPKETPRDSTWEQARQELYGGHPERALDPTAFVEYNDETVKRLKGALIEALKNASNIRRLKPEDSVVVSVLGGPAPAERSAKSGNRRASVSSAGLSASPDAGDIRMQRTILTISVKKQDVDACAEGKLSLEEFRQKARAAAYAGEMTEGGAGGAGVFTGSAGGGFGGGFGGGGYGGGAGRPGAGPR